MSINRGMGYDNGSNPFQYHSPNISPMNSIHQSRSPQRSPRFAQSAPLGPVKHPHSKTLPNMAALPPMMGLPMNVINNRSI